jgi:hypothetical protein
MTPAEARAILARITYKPGHRFRLVGELSVVMEAELVDATWPACNISLCFVKPINLYDLPLWKEYDLLQHVKRLCAYAEDHEIKEWLKLDGKCVDEPHPERAHPLPPLAALEAMPGIQERQETLGGLANGYQLG